MASKKSPVKPKDEFTYDANGKIVMNESNFNRIPNPDDCSDTTGNNGNNCTTNANKKDKKCNTNTNKCDKPCQDTPPPPPTPPCPCPCPDTTTTTTDDCCIRSLPKILMTFGTGFALGAAINHIFQRIMCKRASQTCSVDQQPCSKNAVQPTPPPVPVPPQSCANIDLVKNCPINTCPPQQSQECDPLPLKRRTHRKKCRHGHLHRRNNNNNNNNNRNNFGLVDG